MNTNGRYKINVPKIVHETIEGETVILNLDNGNYYSLVGVGAHIWSWIEKGASADNIVERLRRDYEGGHEVMETAVNKFLQELLDEKLTARDTSNDGRDSSPEVTENSSGRHKTAFQAPLLNKYTDMQDLLLLDPIHDVDEETGWPNADDKKGWPTRDQDLSP